MIVTIDGPVASGKSSVAKELARRLSFNHVNTGLLYRVVAYLSVVHHNEKLSVPEDMRYDFVDGKPMVYWHEVVIEESLLYSPLIDQEASRLSADPALRCLLLPLQKHVAATYNIIADGRDCGSVVYPQAEVKFFLTAEPETRARRLMANKDRHYANLSFEEISHEILVRDCNDQKRAVAPLVIPQGAIVIDSTNLTFEQTVDTLYEFIAQAIRQKRGKGEQV